MPTSTDDTTLNGTPPAQPAGDTSAQVQVPASENVTITKQEFDALQKSIRQLESLARAEKDKAINKTNQRVDGLEQYKPLLERIATEIAGGATVDEAINRASRVDRESKVQDALLGIYEAMQGGKLSFGGAEGGPSDQPDAKVAEVVAKFDFGKDDVDANSLVQRFGKDPDRLEGELAKLALQRQKTTPTPAQSPAPQGATPHTASQAELNAAYEKRKKELQDSNLLTPKSLADLKKEFRGKGLPIW